MNRISRTDFGGVRAGLIFVMVVLGVLLLALPGSARGSDAGSAETTEAPSATHAEDVTAHATSSSARLLAFYAQPPGEATHELYVVAEDGTGLQRLSSETVDVFGGRWSPDGQQLVYEADGRIYTVRPDGSDRRFVATGTSPVWSPTGDGLAYAGQIDDQGIWIARPDGTQATRVASTGMGPTWSPDGRYLAFYALSSSAGDWDVYVYDVVDGSSWNVTARPGAQQTPTWSADGTWIAYSSHDGHWSEQDVYVTDVAGTTHVGVSADLGYAQISSAAGPAGQAWSPSDNRLAYHGYEQSLTGTSHIYLVSPDGSQRQRLQEGLSAAWSPDGSRIAFDGGGFIRIMNADGSNAASITPDGLQAFGPIWQPTPGTADPVDPLARLAGDGRVETATAISAWAFDLADAVVVASAEAFPDALAAAPLAGAVDGPVLLTSPAGLDDPVAEEIRRLGASQVWIVGGTAAVTEAVENDLASIAGISPDGVRRLGGTTRWETAAEIAHEVISRTDSDEALLVNGLGFPDAVSASAYAAELGAPVLLVPPEGPLPEATQQLLASRGWAGLTAVGGTAVLSDATLDEAKRAARVDGPRHRLSGRDRYATSVSVADARHARSAHSSSEVLLATGDNWPDALGAGPAAAARGAEFILTPPDDLSNSETQAWLEHNADRLDGGWIAGGPAAVSDQVARQAAEKIR